VNRDPHDTNDGNWRGMGIKSPSDCILTLEDNDIALESERDAESDNNVRNTSKNNKERKIDDELNSDFEFEGCRVLVE